MPDHHMKFQVIMGHPVQPGMRIMIFTPIYGLRSGQPCKARSQKPRNLKNPECTKLRCKMRWKGESDE